MTAAVVSYLSADVIHNLLIMLNGVSSSCRHQIRLPLAHWMSTCLKVQLCKVNNIKWKTNTDPYWERSWARRVWWTGTQNFAKHDRFEIPLTRKQPATEAFRFLWADESGKQTTARQQKLQTTAGGRRRRGSRSRAVVAMQMHLN